MKKHVAGGKKKKRFVAVATDHRGLKLWEKDGDDVRSLITDADKAAPNAQSVTIRDDRTSDGAYWGPGRGRQVASRDRSRKLDDGRYYPGWITE